MNLTIPRLSGGQEIEQLINFPDDDLQSSLHVLPRVGEEDAEGGEEEEQGGHRQEVGDLPPGPGEDGVEEDGEEVEQED